MLGMSEKKTCTYCKRTKTLSRFTKREGPSRGGYAARCKPCNAMLAREYKQKRAARLFYRPVNGTMHENVKYVRKNCAACIVEFFPTSAVNRWCTPCSQISEIVMHAMRVKGATESITAVIQKHMAAKDCGYCGREFTDANRKSFDHVVPVKSGGTNDADNIAISCWECNASKAALRMDDWINLCRLVVKKAS